MIPLSGVCVSIDAFARPLTLRTPSGAYVGGRWADGPPADTPIMGVMLAIKARDLADLPEGIRDKAAKMLWTRAPVATADDGTGRPADLIVDGGRIWRVIAVNERDEAGFVKAALERVDDRGRTV